VPIFQATSTDEHREVPRAPSRRTMTDRPTFIAPPLAAGRRRYLTMLFSDLSESTRIASAIEAEHYAELLGELRDAYHVLIPRHGGTIVQISGDGILAVFGHPDPREDAGRRAAEAALDLHERVRGLRADVAGLPTLTMHTGIHSGLVLLDEGDAERGRFELLGNATNIASRLADIAHADEILISESTLGPESSFFQKSERRYLHLRGKEKPLTVYRIIARAPVTTQFEARTRRGLVPFVGRESELAALESGLAEAIAGKPRFMAVIGPAGLGKTRLAEEFLARATRRQCRVLRGYCDGYLAAEPLQPFLQTLRSLAGLTPRMPPAQAAEALERMLLEIDPALEAHRTVLLAALSLGAADPQAETKRPAAEMITAAVRDLFERLAQSAPLVLFVDDLQWADDATRQVLGAIRGLSRPIFILVAKRNSPDEGFAIGDARGLDLPPLTEDEAAQTIGHLLRVPDPDVVNAIRKSSGGNPLYIEELCHSAAYEGQDRRLSRATLGSAWLNNLIQSRVARLPGPQADLVRVAAVIGNVIPVWLLEKLTGCGEDDALVLALAEQDFLFPGEAPGTLRFKHGITRDVIYDAVGLHQRKDMHLRIAAALVHGGSEASHGENFEALALHFGAGGRPGDAARYAELAGDKAVAASALDRAQSQYRAALTALDQLPPTQANYLRWNAIVQRFGLVCVFDPAREQLGILRRAVELAETNDDRPAIARAQYWLGYVCYALGEPREGALHLELALAAAEEIRDQRFALRIRATLGQARTAAGDYDRGLPLLDEAITMRRNRALERPAVGFSYTLCCKAAVLGDLGHFEEAQACFDEALDAVKGANHEVEASVLGFRSAVYLWQGRWQDAYDTATDAQRVAERVKSVFLLAADRSLAAYAKWSLDHSPEALQAIVDATAWMESRDKRLNISMNYGWLCMAMQHTGRIAEMRAYAFHAIDRARAHDRLGLAMTYRALARAAAEGHGRRKAKSYLAAAMKAAEARGSRHDVAATQLCGAEIAAQRGDRAEALSYLDAAEAAFIGMGMAWHLEKAREARRSLDH